MADPIVNIHSMSVDGTAAVNWSVRIQRDHLYNASQDAVILFSIKLFEILQSIIRFDFAELNNRALKRIPDPEI